MEQIKPLYNWKLLIDAFWQYRALYCQVNGHFAVELRKDKPGWTLDVYEEVDNDEYIRYGTLQPDVESPLDRPIATRVIMKMREDGIVTMEHTYEIGRLKFYPPKSITT
jgi:hypothetical protein